MKSRTRKGGARGESGGLLRLSLSTTKDVSQEKRQRLSLSKLAKSKECFVRIDKLLRGRIIDHLLLSDAGSFSRAIQASFRFDYSFAARCLQLALVVN